MAECGIREKDHVIVSHTGGTSPVLLICEHASSLIPPEYKDLGLSTDALESHAAWDPGAYAVSQHLSANLDAPLIASGVSRLVYDCNRPPSAPDAMPARSEMIDVPGNATLTGVDRAARAAAIYEPFQTALRERLEQMPHPIVVTIHSFTPIYYGAKRQVEIGILHDSDAVLADAMLLRAGHHISADVQRNQPYGPEHGVTHTLQEHAIAHGHPNVMIEIRSDLIETAEQQADIGKRLARWIADAAQTLKLPKAVTCKV